MPSSAVPTRLHLWTNAVELIEADPAEPVACAACKAGTLEGEDVRSGTDPGVGDRTICCPRCGTSSTSRYRFGPRLAAADLAAG